MADTKISALPASTTPLAGTEVLPIVQSGATKKVSVADLTAGRQTSASGFEALGATGVTPASPILYQIKNTTDGAGWSTTAPWGRYSFYSNDASGSGPQTHIALDAVMRASTGAYSKLSIKLADGAGALVERIVVDPVAGDTTLSTGNLVIGTSGKGIDFSATSHPAGMTSELLNDYEEGTFTPTIVGQTTAGTGTYSIQVGRYTKIGNRVLFQLWVSWSAHDGTGNMRIGGLPYTSNSTSSNFGSVAIGRCANITLTANNVCVIYIANNSLVMQVQQYPVGGGAATSVPIDSAGEFMIAGNYEV